MRINEIFYSLQGEGRWTGTPCVFVRFAGCNMKCGFCDTNHEPYKELTEEEIVAEIGKYPTEHIVFTGGEPTLQLNRKLLLMLAEYYVHLETNGTQMMSGLEEYVDWITCSPKNKHIVIERIDELKVVYQGQDMAQYDELDVTDSECLYVQPCDTKDENQNADNLRECINFIESHPEWKLSLQTQKILNVR